MFAPYPGAMFRRCVPAPYPGGVVGWQIKKPPSFDGGFCLRGLPFVASFDLNQGFVRNRGHRLALAAQADRRVRRGDAQLRLRVALGVGFHPLQAGGVDHFVQGLRLGRG